jgi:hypothetical protein
VNRGAYFTRLNSTTDIDAGGPGVRNALPFLLFFLTATPAAAHDGFAGHSVYAADLCQARASICRADALSRLRCDAARNAAVRQRFAQMDRQFHADYHGNYQPTVWVPTPDLGAPRPPSNPPSAEGTRPTEVVPVPAGPSPLPGPGGPQAGHGGPTRSASADRPMQ